MSSWLYSSCFETDHYQRKFCIQPEYTTNCALFVPVILCEIMRGFYEFYIDKIELPSTSTSWSSVESCSTLFFP